LKTLSVVCSLFQYKKFIHSLAKANIDLIILA
jgi:hypothetical protein